MITRCLGTWTTKEHAPVEMGTKEPLHDERPSDTACDACLRAMRVPVVCKWCEKIGTVSGLCDRCELRLSVQVGRPTVELAVYRAGCEPLSGQYDGAGAVLRLRAAMKEPGYCGFSLRAMAGVA